MASPDEPKSAILGGTEHDIAIAEQAERLRYHAGIEHRDIGADQHDGTGGTALERAIHPGAQIATPLAYCPELPAPMPDAMARGVRRDGDPHAPAPVCREAAHEQRDHQPFETHCSGVADAARQ